MRVPRLVGRMAIDARDAAAGSGLLLAAPDRPDFPEAMVEYIVRQYPDPGVEVPRGAVVTVWFDGGEGEGGAGVRVPLDPGPRGGGMLRELDEPEEPGEPSEVVSPCH